MDPFSAASYFGMRPSAYDASDAGPQPSSALPAVTGAASGSAWSHPDVAIFGLVLVAAALLGHATKPVASAGAKGSLGPAKGSIEGSL